MLDEDRNLERKADMFSKRTINQEKRFKFPNDQFYMKTEEEMRAALKDFPEACDNTIEVA